MQGHSLIRLVGFRSSKGRLAEKRTRMMGIEVLITVKIKNPLVEDQFGICSYHVHSFSIFLQDSFFLGGESCGPFSAEVELVYFGGPKLPVIDPRTPGGETERIWFQSRDQVE